MRMIMPPKKRHCTDTSHGNTLLGWLGRQETREGTEGEVHESVRVTQPTQQKNDDRPAASVKLKVYKFQENWQSGQDWLMFDKDRNVMFCDVCQKCDKSKKPNSFRDSGTSSFRKQIVEAHERSELHIQAMAYKHTMETSPSERPMEKLAHSMNLMELEQMKILFRTAFYLAKNNKPFRDFPELVKLQSANGLKVGENYCSDKQARVFTSFI